MAVKVSPPKEAVSQALSASYVAPKKTVNLAATIMCSLNLPIPRKDGACGQPAAIMSLGRHGCQREANLGWDLADNDSNSTVNNYFVNLISVLVSNVAVGYSIQSVTNNISRTELDSHANMPVMGSDAVVVSDTGRVMEVNPFTPYYDAIKVKLVDTALKYDCPHEDKSYI
eukprot:1550043-Ditylum_brightwellii.AAC.1